MATRARERLKQAEQLLTLAESNADDSDLFRTCFEAFITFARSVLHVLKDEVERARGWSCFEPEWGKLEGEVLPAFFRKSRDLLLKEGLKGNSRTRKVIHDYPRVEIKIIPSTSVAGEDIREMPDERAHGVYRASPSKQPHEKGYTFPQGTVEHFFADGPCRDGEVFTVSRQYVERLREAIVKAENCGA